MKNNLQPQPFDQTELPVRQEEGQYIPAGILHQQVVMEDLMSNGFSWEEAVKLLHFHDQLYTNEEMRQRVAGDQRMQFVRWLYEQGELNEM